jgi:BirA family biotin operon repressor/biotin-[acetyl-CoA-carboxylase] ligase
MTKTGYDFFEYDEIDSTNLEAKRFVAKKSTATKQVFLAKKQTGGRGRLGRSFFSPEETGLYMSLLLQIDEKLLDTDLITPAAGVAVCRTIEEFSLEKPKIKWVNDIYLNKKKVCGILTEGILNPKEGKISQVIIGIGVNLFEPKTGFPTEIENIAGFVFNKDCFKNPEETKYQFVAKLLENLEITLEKSQEKITMEEYKERSLVIGKTVTVITGQSTYSALVKDVTEKGHLIVEDLEQGKITQLYSGEVSLKL